MGLYGVWNIQKIRGKIVMNSDERAQAIIKEFKKITLEQMEQMLIKLGIPTDRKIGSDENGGKEYAKR